MGFKLIAIFLFHNHFHFFSQAIQIILNLERSSCAFPRPVISEKPDYEKVTVSYHNLFVYGIPFISTITSP
jgi:hypothetical protein